MRQRQWIVFPLLTAASLFVLIPLWIMFLDSLKSGTELAANAWGFPAQPTFQNYIDLISYNSGIMIRTFLNSVFVSTAYTIITLLVSCLAAFAFAKYRFTGRNLIFILLIATMMIPAELTMPAIYLMFSKVKLLNTYSIQIFPALPMRFAYSC